MDPWRYQVLLSVIRRRAGENRVSRAIKKSRMNKGFGKTRTPTHKALVVLALESQLLIARCLLFS